MTKLQIGLASLIIIVAGFVTGYLLSTKFVPQIAETSTRVIETDKEVGVKNMKVFSSSAQGILEKGGLNGEGTHHLVRDGGPSQTAYLVSSVVDLDEFVGKKVEIWGETFKGQKAGWFMDVGLVKLLE